MAKEKLAELIGAIIGEAEKSENFPGSMTEEGLKAIINLLEGNSVKESVFESERLAGIIAMTFAGEQRIRHLTISILRLDENRAPDHGHPLGMLRHVDGEGWWMKVPQQ